MADATAEEITAPIIFFYEKQQHPALFGDADVALMFIGGDAHWEADGTIEMFDAEGRRLHYRYAAPRREKWWQGLTDYSDFEIVGTDAAGLRARLSAALARGSGSAPSRDVPLSELVDDAFARWMVD